MGRTTSAKRAVLDEANSGTFWRSRTLTMRHYPRAVFRLKQRNTKNARRVLAAAGHVPPPLRKGT